MLNTIFSSCYTEAVNSLKELDGPIMSMDEVWKWVEEQKCRQSMKVELISVNDLKGWNFSSVSGNLCHDSGRFFSTSGIQWGNEQSPIMLQAEVGILGVLVTEYKGVLHLLIQAKVEPGNINGVQISPTVQATRSNYTRVHGGTEPPYLSYFFDNTGQIIADQFQSEQGRRYFRKKNRNVILKIDSLITAEKGFAWVTLGQLRELYTKDNLINSCLRSVLGSSPWQQYAGSSYWQDIEILSFLRKRRESSLESSKLISLNRLSSWQLVDGKYKSLDGNGIEIIGVRAQAVTREVSSWTQPVISETKVGIYGLVVTNYKGSPHFVLRYSLEPGCRDNVEWSTTWINRDGDENSSPEHWKTLLENTINSKIVFNKSFSEEGGRFYQSVFNHIVYFIPNIDSELPDNCVLMSSSQISRFIIHAQYFSIELRSILSCLDEDWFNE